MDEHASIFYVTPANHYVLCTDSELETLVSKRRRSMLQYFYHLYGDNFPPFRTAYTKGSHLVMRVIYNPEKTEQLRRPDGYVDRYIEFDREWLQKHEMAFDLAFPAGLPMSLIRAYSKPELDC